MTTPYDAAVMLAQIEYDTNVLLLEKLTAFTADLTAVADTLSFPPTHISPARSLISEILGTMGYRIHSELPQRIAEYERATRPPEPMPTTPTA